MERVLNEIAGEDISALLQKALRSTDDLPLETLLAQVGVDYKLRQASSNSDKGGNAGKESKQTPLALGVRYGTDPLGAKLLNVFDDGAAQQAGLSAGDVVIAVDGIRATQENIEKLLANHREKQHVAVHAFRRDELMSFSVPIQEAPEDTVYLELAEQTGKEALRLRNAWLGITE
jgi:predicted metalloprotease with PDZ domain